MRYITSMKTFRVKYRVTQICEATVQAENEEAAYDKCALGSGLMDEAVECTEYEDDISCYEVPMCEPVNGMEER